MSARLSDERVQELTAPTYATAPQYDDVVSLAREVQELRVKLAAIDAELVELLACHQPEWTSPEAKEAGKEPWCCYICGPADGSWPCTSHEIADEMHRILHPGEPT